jgi:hypothetical protein
MQIRRRKKMMHGDEDTKAKRTPSTSTVIPALRKDQQNL